MPNEADVVIEHANEVVCKLFAQLHLTEDEKKFVNETAWRLKEVAWESLLAVPEEKSKHMRGIVMALAIAMIIGPWQVADHGVDGFSAT